MDCPAPQDVDGSTWSIHNNTEVVSYQCMGGYTHDGGQLVLICHMGNWTGSTPLCTAIKFPLGMVCGVLTGVVIVLGVFIFDFARYKRRKMRSRGRQVKHPEGEERIRPTRFYLTNGEYVPVDYMAITRDALLELYIDVVNKSKGDRDSFKKGKRRVLPPITGSVVNDRGRKVGDKGKRKVKKKRISPMNSMVEDDASEQNGFFDKPSKIGDGSKQNRIIDEAVKKSNGSKQNGIIDKTVKKGYANVSNGFVDKPVQKKKAKQKLNETDPAQHYAAQDYDNAHSISQNAQNYYRPYQTAPSLLPSVQPLTVNASVHHPQLYHQTIPLTTPSQIPQTPVTDKRYPPQAGATSVRFHPGHLPQDAPIYHVSQHALPPRSLPKLPPKLSGDSNNAHHHDTGTGTHPRHYGNNEGGHPAEQHLYLENETGQKNTFRC